MPRASPLEPAVGVSRGSGTRTATPSPSRPTSEPATTHEQPTLVRARLGGGPDDQGARQDDRALPRAVLAAHPAEQQLAGGAAGLVRRVAHRGERRADQGGG